MQYFVTRHPGAVAWARQQGFDAQQISHLDLDILHPGDVVAGTLPAHLIAELGRRGVRYLHLVMDVPEEKRGRDLSAEDMVALGARLQEIAAQATAPQPAEAGPPRAGAGRGDGASGPGAWFGRGAGALLGLLRRLDQSLLEPAAARAHAAFLGADLPPRDRAALRVVEAAFVAWALFALGSSASDFPGAAVCLVTGPVEGAGMPFKECGDAFGGRLLALVFQFGLFVLFLLVGRWALTVTNEVAESRADLVEARDAKARALIMGLSPWAGDAREMAERYRDDLAAYIPPVRHGGTKAGGPWQQNARAIAHHLERLEVVYVLPSDGSRDLFPAFQDFCRTLFRKPLDIRLVRDVHGAEFELADAPEGERRIYENYAYVHSGLRAALEQAKRDLPGLKESDVCIDATAGQKTFSIAAGILTLNRDTRFGYVTSTSPLPDDQQGGEVRVYDARITFTGHLLEAVRDA